MDEFEDLRIVSFDETQVLASRRAPSFKRMALVLSSAPPPGWGPMLQSKYQSTSSVDKRIEVTGRNIWVECQPEDLQAVLDELKPLVAQTNADVRAEMARLKLEQETRNQAALAEKERLASIKRNLKFD